MSDRISPPNDGSRTAGSSDEAATARTRGLIDDLVMDLEPVRRIPSIRIVASALIACFAACVVVLTLMMGFSQQRLAAIFDGWLATGIVVGLVLCASAGSVAGLASAVPGRDELLRAMRATALGGIALALACATYVVVLMGTQSAVPLAQDGICFSAASGMAVLPGIVLVAFQRNGWIEHPRDAAALALLGSFGLGAMAIHFLCPHLDARHVLLGHVGVPVAVSILAVVPAAFLLRRGTM